MKKANAFLAIAAIAVFFAYANLASAQFDPSSMTGPPTPEQIQQMMQQAGAPEGMQAPDNNSFGAPDGSSEMQGRGAEMQRKGLDRLKKGAKSMQKAVTQMDKAIAGATKAGYPPAQDVLDSLAKGKAALDVINQATDFSEEVQSALDDFNDFVDVLDANIESLNMLANFPRIEKQAKREMDNLDKFYAKAKVKLEKSGLDLTAQLADIETKIAAMKTAYDSALAQAKSGDAASAFQTFENDFFPNIGDIRQSIGMLDALKNISRALKQIEKGIKSAEGIIAKVAKKKLDTTQLSQIVADSKTHLEDLKTALKAKDFEPTDAVDHLEALNDLRDQFENTLDDVVGDTNVGKLAPVNFFGGTMPTMPAIPQAGGKNGNGEGNAFGIEKMDAGF